MTSNKNKTFIRVVAVVLAVLTAFSLLVSVVSSLRASATSSIDSLKDRQEELENQKKQLESQIEEAEQNQLSIVVQKKLLDEQVTNTQNQIDSATALIEEYTEFIAQCEIDIQETQKKEEEQWEAYKQRVRVMEESGNISYLDVLFTATSFSELLSKIDSVSEIMEKDKEVYDELVETRNELERLREERKEALVEQQNTKDELEVKKAELDDQVAEAAALIQQYEDEINSNQDLIDEIEAEDAKIEEQIKEAQSGSSSVVGEGTYVWPSQASKYVTSLFGYRQSPTAGASTNHKGIDIGASYGTNVLASKSGTVSTATYSSSYGYYIIINHGDGTTTLYAHMSRLLVSRGQTVSQGEVIGLVGSTGISTGAHLHFEITVNGSRVNPLQYFSGYTVSPNA